MVTKKEDLTKRNTRPGEMRRKEGNRLSGDSSADSRGGGPSRPYVKVIHKGKGEKICKTPGSSRNFTGGGRKHAIVSRHRGASKALSIGIFREGKRRGPLDQVRRKKGGEVAGGENYGGEGGGDAYFYGRGAKVRYKEKGIGGLVAVTAGTGRERIVHGGPERRNKRGKTSGKGGRRGGVHNSEPGRARTRQHKEKKLVGFSHGRRPIKGKSSWPKGNAS